MVKTIRNTSPSLITLACLIIVIGGMKLASNLIAPLLLSVFLALIFLPIIKATRRKNIPEWTAISGIVIFLLISGFTVTGLISSSINDLTAKGPLYSQKFAIEFGWIADNLANNGILLNKTFITNHIDPTALVGAAIPLLSGLTNIMGNMFLVTLTVIFILLESDNYPRKLHEAIQRPRNGISKSTMLIESINSYLRIKTVISLCTGLLSGALCFAIGLEHFALWGLLMFMFNYIPNIGSFIVAIPIVLLTIVDVNFYAACILAIGLAGINIVMGNVIEPKYMGKGLGLSTLVVFLSLLVWGWIFGIIGLLLSVPLTMCLKLYLESSESTQWMAHLMNSYTEENTKC